LIELKGYFALKIMHKLIIVILLAGWITACKPAQPTHTPADPAAATPPSASPELESTIVATVTEYVFPVPPTASGPKDMREWSDLKTGKGPVYSQDWSPDGALFATADTNQIRLWDLAIGREAGVLTGHNDFIWGLAWYPVSGSNLLASASQDGTVRLWDVTTLAQTAVFETGWAFCLNWSPDGGQLAVGIDSGAVQVWDVASRQLIQTWQGSANSEVISIAWSPDGKMVASGELGGDINLWDAASGQLSATLSGYTAERSDVNGLAWSPDGTQLASAHQDGKLRIWDVSTSQVLLTIDAHTGWARGVSWSPDGSMLASGGEDKRICLWNAETGQEYAEQHHNRLSVWSVSWSPDGTKVASGGGAYQEAHVGATIIWLVP